MGDGRTLLRQGQDILQCTACRQAVGDKGTEGALGRFGFADRGPEVHQGLIEITGPVSRNKGRRKCGEFLLGRPLIDGVPKGEQAGHDSADIPVHGGDGPAKSHAEDGAGCVITNAGKRSEPLPGVGEVTPEAGDNQSGSGMEMAGSGIIARFCHTIRTSCRGAAARVNTVGKAARNRP